MKKIVVFTISFLIFVSPAISKKFDFSQVQGLSTGMKLDKALSVLKQNNIDVDIENTDDGGKIYSFYPTTDIMEISISGIRFVTRNGKISSLRLELLLEYYIELGEKLDKICNCRIFDEDENSDAYLFDNCTVKVDYDDNYVLILGYIGKCKK